MICCSGFCWFLISTAACLIDPGLFLFLFFFLAGVVVSNMITDNPVHPESLYKASLEGVSQNVFEHS